MGHREYFMYSKSGKNTPESILKELSKKVELNSADITEPTIFIYCKATAKKDFEDLNKNQYKKGMVGAVIEPDLLSISDVINSLPNNMIDDVKIFPISIERERYEECFKDSELEVNNKKYLEELKPLKEETTEEDEEEPEM